MAINRMDWPVKIAISDNPPYFLGPNAPAVGCEEQVIDGQTVWRFHCRHCGHGHFHGPGEGREGS